MQKPDRRMRELFREMQSDCVADSPLKDNSEFTASFHMAFSKCSILDWKHGEGGEQSLSESGFIKQM